MDKKRITIIYAVIYPGFLFFPAIISIVILLTGDSDWEFTFNGSAISNKFEVVFFVLLTLIILWILTSYLFYNIIKNRLKR